MKLEVKDTQKSYAATNTESIVETYTTLASGDMFFLSVFMKMIFLMDF